MSFLRRLFGRSKNLPDLDTFPYREVVVLSPIAAKMIKQIRAGDPKAGPLVRVGVRFEGPTGHMYDLKLDDQADPNCDVVCKSHDQWIVVDAKFVGYLDGTSIDFQDTPQGRGFKFNNPRAREA
jgi:iron-sulfur cluster assembly protein